MRDGVSRRYRRTLGRGVALVMVGGLAAGCSSGASRFTDDFYTGSTTNQQSILSSNSSASVAPAPTDGTYTASVNRAAVEPVDMSSRVTRSSLPSPTAPATATATAVAQPVRREVQTAAVETTASARRAIDPLSRSEERDAAEARVRAAETKVKAAEVKATATAEAPVKTARLAVANPAPTMVVKTPEARPSRAEAPAKAPAPVEAPAKQVAVLPNPPKAKESAAPEQTASADTSKKKVAEVAKPKSSKGSYTVAEGDSLSRIAKKHGVSVAALKAANGDSDALRIGQEVKIPAAGETVVATAKPPKLDTTETASIEKKPEKLAASQKISAQPAAYQPPVKQKAISAVEEESDDSAPNSTGIDRMRWPAKGRVAKSRDGIDIQVPEGTPVKAAENGVVIYAGDGLKDFGNTVLVRHSNGLVTVYGHADKLNVKRGQTVKRGEQIATSGMSGQTETPKLHFEVRKDSSPVDPSTYLE